LVPAFTLLLIIDYLVRKAVTYNEAATSTGVSAGLIVNLSLLAMLVTALAMSLRGARPVDRSAAP
jgi:hypothetical protein